MKALFASLLVFGFAAGAQTSSVPEMQPVPGNSNLLASGVPPIPQDLKAVVNRYVNWRGAVAVDSSDDGTQLLISTRFGSTAQLHLVDHPLGTRYQLTFGNEPISRAHFLPGDPSTLFYGQDVGGGEYFQLFRLDRRTAKAELLTDGKSRHESFILSRDGKRLAYSGTGRNGRDTDVYVAPTADPRAAKRVSEFSGSWHPAAFSPVDSTKLLVMKRRSAREAELHLLNLASGEWRQLTPKDEPASVHEARFTADGKGVYLVTDRYSNFNELYRIELSNAAAPPRPLTRSVPWDVEAFAVAPDGGAVALSFNEDGFSRVRLLDTRSSKLTDVPLPKAVVNGVHFPRRRSDLLLLTLQTARSPADVWQYHLKTRQLIRWTHSEVGELNEASLLEPSLVHYPSTDGVSVPALVYRPSKSAPGRRPVIVIWHGGPEGQSRPVFSALAQQLAAELGTAVVLPNVRGSSGYGKVYLDMDNGVKREASLKDIGATLDWIATQRDLDPGRVGVYGGSYGGYMVLATAAFFPNRIRAAVDVVGISRLSSLLTNTSAYRQDLRRAEYGDERLAEVRDVLERISPYNHVEAIQAALFVQQGKNDPRVPMSESEQMVKALKERGRDVWYLLAENEGHGFRKKENQDFAAAATMLFFKEKLLGESHAERSGSSESPGGSP